MSDNESADELTRLEGRDDFLRKAAEDLRNIAASMDRRQCDGIAQRVRAIANRLDRYRGATLFPRLEELRREEYRRDALANDLTRPGRDEALEAAMEREAGVKGFDEP